VLPNGDLVASGRVHNGRRDDRYNIARWYGTSWKRDGSGLHAHAGGFGGPTEPPAVSAARQRRNCCQRHVHRLRGGVPAIGFVELERHGLDGALRQPNHFTVLGHGDSALGGA